MSGSDRSRAAAAALPSPPPLPSSPPPPPLLLLASGNVHKLSEIEAICAPLGWSLVPGPRWRGAAGERLAEVVEDGTTFVGNAVRKAAAAVRVSGLSALADDSGLLVDALGGAPGVHSARFAGQGASDDDHIDKLLAALADVEPPLRRASFVCVLVVAGPIVEGPGCRRTADGIPWRAVSGQVDGEITAARDGTGGFGYDPVFFSTELGMTFGRATAAAKASVSHRGRALAALAPLLAALHTRASAPAAPLFVRRVGLQALAHALQVTLESGLRYATAGLEQALAARPQLGAKERAAVNALLHRALRRLGVYALARQAAQGLPVEVGDCDPRLLRPSDAALLAALTLADVDAAGAPLVHRGPGEASALSALLQRDPALGGVLPLPAAALAKSLRTATFAVGAGSVAWQRALAAGVHPDLVHALAATAATCPADPAASDLALAPADDLAAWLAALPHQAPPTIRARDQADLPALRGDIEGLGAATVAVPGLPGAAMLLQTARTTALPAFAAGRFEIQDASSQRVAALVQASPGMRVLDFCAGAGGKTLALAAAMGHAGTLVATDTDARRLEEARRRLRRAGALDRVQVQQLSRRADDDAALGLFDRVLVDAPCSSSGALRRQPELGWHMDDAWLSRFAPLQRAIALRAAARVAPAGWLIYATCSLLEAENEAVAAALAATLGWRLRDEHRFGLADATLQRSGPLPAITPDGLYAAILERPA